MINELNFHQLKIFVAVAHLESFTRAADSLSISQPAVSAQVKELESTCGTPLLRKSGRQVRLTEAGQLVYEYGRRIFTLADEMGRALDDLKGFRSGSLTVGASTTIGEYLLPQAMGRFQETYPGIELKLEIANSSVISKKVLNHEVDIGVIGDHQSLKSLETEPYQRDEIVLFASPRNRLSGLDTILAADVDAEKFIARESGSATRRIGESKLVEMGVSPRNVMELSSNEAVKRAVEANLGIGMLSKSAVSMDFESGRLSRLKVPDFICERRFYIIYTVGKRLSKLESAFIASLKDS